MASAKRSPNYLSSPTSDSDLAPPSDDAGPVYFFGDPATAHFSQWYLMDFVAPLPTRESIVGGRKTTEELRALLAQFQAGSETVDTSGGEKSAATATATTPAAKTTPAATTAVKWHTSTSAEQYMMYAKAVLFEDHAITTELLKVPGNPRECKALGRKVANFDKPLWEEHCEHAVEEGNWWKFVNGVGKDGRRVQKLLQDTGDRDIVEASPHDRIWGIGFKAKDAGPNRHRWGQNLLGKAIVRVRERMRE